MSGYEQVPENTAARPFADHLLEAMVFGTEQAILRSEAEGQRQLVASDVLPTAAPWDELIALGFTRGAEVAGDPMFTHCTLPTGWRKQGTDHSMHSVVLDERGIERVSVFYKAAFYDRRANAYVIDVGRAEASKVIYGDEAVALPAKWDAFTDGEKRAFAEGVRDSTNYAHPERVDATKRLLPAAPEADA
jgi:hypothetical protein